MNGLRLVPRTEAAAVIVLPVGRRSDIGDGAISTGLIHLLYSITCARGVDSLVLSPFEIRTIETALAVNATSWQRQRGLHVIADNYPQWAATDEGASEVERFVAWIAPYCTQQMLTDIIAAISISEDGYNADVRTNAAWDLDALLREAVDGPAPGPGAA